MITYVVWDYKTGRVADRFEFSAAAARQPGYIEHAMRDYADRSRWHIEEVPRG